MLINEGNEVLKVVEVSTKNQTARIKKHHAWKRFLRFSTSTPTPLVGEEIVVNLELYSFDLELEDYVLEEEDSEVFVMVNGEKQSVLLTHGVGEITLTVPEVGLEVSLCTESHDYGFEPLIIEPTFIQGELMQAQTLLNTEFLVILAEITQM